MIKELIIIIIKNIYICELPPTHKLSTTPSNTKINKYRLIVFFSFKRGKLLRFDNAIAFTYCDILSFLCIVRGLFAVQLNHGIPKQYYRHFWTTFRWVSFEVLATAELSRNLYTFEMKFCALLRVVSEHVGSFWTSGRYEEKGSVYKADSTFLVNFPLNLKEILVSSYLLQSDTSQHFVIDLLALLKLQYGRL